MTDTAKNDMVEREMDVLKGPPGLLFGLTLLVFLFAGLYFSWVPGEPITASPPPASPLTAPR